MPQKKKYPSSAARQAAYRQRQELRELPAVKSAIKNIQKLLLRVERLEKAARERGTDLGGFISPVKQPKKRKKGKR